MKRLYIIPIMLCAALSVSAQEVEGEFKTSGDTVQIDRTVYVEREFQPIVQQAGKIAIKPQVYEPQIVLQQPVYSAYNSPLSMDYNVRQLDFSTLNFCHREPMHGFLRAGVGHVNSLFDFNYRVTDSQMQQRKRKNTSNDLVLDLHAHHLGQWGRKTLSESTLGIDFSKQFHSIELFFGGEGGNDYYTRYGAYYNMANDSLEVKRFLDMTQTDDRQAIWTANAHIGVKSLPNAEIEYMAEAEYESFIVPGYAIEHQAHTQGAFEWGSNYHHVGAELDIQNRFYSTQDTAVHPFTNHRIHIEPYYMYNGNRLHVHAGVNLDFSAGRGRVAGVSPNVRFEADLTKNWLAAYVNATGFYEANGAYGEYKENRYRSIKCLFADTISGAYTPIDLDFGFKIRPYATLFMNIHAGYALTLDRHVNVFGLATSEVPKGQFEHDTQNQSVFRVGADLHYHFRDIFFLQASGMYFAGKALTAVENLQDAKGNNSLFDAPQWSARLRMDVKVDQKWSVYSDNFFMGGNKACVYDGSTYTVKDMRPMLDLNIGLQYNVNRWLSVYAQLNNYLAWTNKLSYMTFYGYEAQRANCMLGLSYSF